MLHGTKVCVKTPPTRAQVQDALAEDWFNVSNRVGKGVMADKMGVDSDTINRAITKANLPRADNLIASLLACPAALQSTLALVGMKAVPESQEAANDLHTVGELTGLATVFLRVLEDGRRDHGETLELAKLIGPLVAKLSALLEEARHIQGVAA